MNIGNMQAASGRLQEALDDLLQAWESTREHWDDQTAREFEERVLHVLRQELAAAFPAITQMSQAFQAAQRQVEE